ncbi:CHAT domain-containing tetratricopeptide repeat protein [Xenococcus sp. PCC 7305]|uniref:CHAT domain-containing tetratricopeptide repeat protein n=1 Tax=Xenococcus sp. PCC 7305 TaxID=102125 RepID=UPI00118197C8|nr:CHAT domain-containing tetratricopeptide repeat protein [Xenococcus sp. PCC 7305]
MGVASYYLGSYQQSINYHLDQLEIVKELGNKELTSSILINIGNVFQSQGNYDLALKYYQHSLEINREIGNQSREAKCYSNLGATFHYLSQIDNAIYHNKLSLNLAREINDFAQQAVALRNLGCTYESLGKYQEAKDFYEEDLALTNKIGDRHGEAQCLGNIGNIYQALGEFDYAINFHEQSLIINRELGIRLGETRSLTNLGVAYRSLQQYEKAIQHHQESLKISQEIGNYQEEGTVLLNLANVYLSTQDYNKEYEYLELALKIFQQIDNLRGQAYVLGSLGVACRNLGQQEKAIEYVQKQFILADKIDDSRLKGVALTHKGSLMLYQNNLSQSKEALLQAVNIWESLRIGLNHDVDKVSLFNTQTDAYFLLQKVLVAQNKYCEALEISERSRARALFESIKIISTELSTQSHLQKVEELPNINKLTETAVNHSATVVEYSIIDPDILYIWVIKPSGELIFRNVDLNPLLEDDTSLREISREMQQRLDAGSWLEDASNFSQQLYDCLIQPITDLLPKNSDELVIFIPQHELFLVPFSALQNKTGEFLIERYTILIAPSIQILELTREQKERIRLKTKSNALVVGNPKMPIIPFSKPQKPLKPLPHSKQEAEEIATILNTEAITGSKATKTYIKQLLPKASLIHLATHGLLDLFDELGIPGAIAFAPSNGDSGFLNSSEILNLNLSADLVVLSACNSGRGVITNDGILGLSRCFLIAGVSSLIVSLWEVSDNSTKLLMIKFYENLQNEMNKAQALRQAMLSVMEEYRNCPQMWAAFTLIGEV